MIPTQDLQDEIRRVSKACDSYSTMLVVGIGGSSLGLRAFTFALGSRSRQIIVCDDLDPVLFQTATQHLDWRKTLINIVSKSGGTIEIMALTSIVLERLKAAVGKKWTDHVIVTTDPETGFLRRWATDHGLWSCRVPSDVGGRFSVFTAVGMLPLYWAGYRVDEVWKGAHEAFADPQPQKWAEQHVTWDREGRHIAVIMPYAGCLMDYARWFAQLWAESLGKDGKGQTPMVAVGTADQHSQLQMFAEGPKDKCIRFVTVERWPADVLIPAPIDPAASCLSGKSMGQLLSTAAAATAQALAQVGCPSYTIQLPNLTEHAMGHLMMTDIMTTVAAAKLYGVNPYGQPGVELGKKLWRELLFAC